MMQSIHKPWIKLMDSLSREDYESITRLEKECIQSDKTSLKLELGYKLAMAGEFGSTGMKNINEFLYFDTDLLIGYIGMGCFGQTPEIMGMVHPDYRGQGIFTMLHSLLMPELRRRKFKSAELLCDGDSTSGQRFIQKTGARKHHSEYEMYLKRDDALKGWPDLKVVFRKAVNADSKEILRQNAIYFGEEQPAGEEEKEGGNIPEVLPEVEEKRGMTIYFAYLNNQIIGKIHLQLIDGLGGIYGLGILPEYRGKGLGRALLLGGIQKLKESGAREVMLQVATENANALHLYTSCGFDTTSFMDYYQLIL